MTHFVPSSRLVALSIALCTLTVSPTLAFAQQEKILFTAVDNAKQEIINRINAEKIRLDVGMWILVDGDITQTIINKHKSGVPVRILGDRITIFEQADKNTYNLFLAMANAGVPIRVRRHPTDFPAILHWKAGIFVGQQIVEFGSANWTTFELAPWSATDFKDETAMFTGVEDLSVFHAFLTMFDNYWVDTQYFEDWPSAYKAETGQTWTVPMNISHVKAETVEYPTNIPGMGWSQGSELSTAMIAEMNAEPRGGTIDMVSYRLTDPALVDTLIARKKAGVNVRVFIEPTQYRNDGFPEFWLVGAMTDRLWLAGIPIMQRTHQGLTHMKVLITSRSALIASSNFTTNWQRDHNYFVQASTKPLLYQSVRNRFNAMWDEVEVSNIRTRYDYFKPLRPIEPKIPLPANGAINVAPTTKLEWERAPFATSFDVLLGPVNGTMALVGRVNAVVTADPPATYSFTPAQPLQPNTLYNWRVVSRSYATDVDPLLVTASDIWSFTTGASTGGGSGGGGAASGPFGGTALALPGTIQAENFDNGGSNVAYLDTTVGNAGGQYRTTDNVDIEATNDGGPGWNVGWVSAGEWLKYTVNVGTSGNYNLEFRVASAGAGGTFHLEVDGVNKTGTLTVPGTGDWQSWTTVTKTGVSLAAGQQVWRLVFDGAGSGGAIGNVNYIRVVAGTTGGGGTTTPTNTPYLGTRTALPGTLQAENFDEGGNGVGWQDNSAGNSGGACRTNVDVDIELTTDTGGGCNLGWIAVGEWLKYSVNVTAAGNYNLEFRVAASGAGGRFHLEVDGVDKTGALTIPNTGDWQTWTTVTKTGVALSAGNQVWKLVFDAAGSVVGNVNYIKVTAAGGGGTPPATPTATPYGGTAKSLPGTIEAEQFDEGGQNLAYSDLTVGNSGGEFRTTWDVDIESSLDTGGGYNIGWVGAGEWLQYSVNVATAGTYTLQFRVASPSAGGTFKLEVNGVDKTGVMTIPGTGDWQTWTTVSKTGVALSAGPQVWKLVMIGNAPNTGGVGNFNWIKVVSGVAALQQPEAIRADTVPAASHFSVIEASDLFVATVPPVTVAVREDGVCVVDPRRTTVRVGA